MAHLMDSEMTKLFRRAVLANRKRSADMMQIDIATLTAGAAASVACDAFEVGPAHPLGLAVEAGYIDVSVEVLTQDRGSGFGIGQRDFDVAVEATRSAERRVDTRRIIGRADDNHAASRGHDSMRRDRPERSDEGRSFGRHLADLAARQAERQRPARLSRSDTET